MGTERVFSNRPGHGEGDARPVFEDACLEDATPNESARERNARRQRNYRKRKRALEVANIRALQDCTPNPERTPGTRTRARFLSQDGTPPEVPSSVDAQRTRTGASFLTQDGTPQVDLPALDSPTDRLQQAATRRAQWAANDGTQALDGDQALDSPTPPLSEDALKQTCKG